MNNPGNQIRDMVDAERILFDLNPTATWPEWMTKDACGMCLTLGFSKESTTVLINFFQFSPEWAECIVTDTEPTAVIEMIAVILYTFDRSTIGSLRDCRKTAFTLVLLAVYMATVKGIELLDGHGVDNEV